MNMLKQKNQEYIELEYKTGRGKHFIHIDLENDSIWVDLKYFPQSTFLCAMCDGTPIRWTKCGLRKQERTFVNIDWLIEDWGGDKRLVDLIKNRKDKILSSLPDLKIKYGKSDSVKMNDDWIDGYNGENILGKKRDRWVTHWMALPDKPDKPDKP